MAIAFCWHIHSVSEWRARSYSKNIGICQPHQCSLKRSVTALIKGVRYYWKTHVKMCRWQCIKLDPNCTAILWKGKWWCQTKRRRVWRGQKYWRFHKNKPYYISHQVCQAHSATWDSRCVEKKTTWKIFSKAAIYCSAPLFNTRQWNTKALCWQKHIFWHADTLGEYLFNASNGSGFKSSCSQFKFQKSYLKDSMWVEINEMALKLHF